MIEIEAFVVAQRKIVFITLEHTTAKLKVLYAVLQMIILVLFILGQSSSVFYKIANDITFLLNILAKLFTINTNTTTTSLQTFLSSLSQRKASIVLNLEQDITPRTLDSLS